MDFKQRLNIVNDILAACPYASYKQTIKNLFDIEEDILLRLIVIDSCYSTNLNRRYFAFEELAEKIKAIDADLNENIDVIEFMKKHLNCMKDSIGIDKKGKKAGCAFSLTTKYIYFKTNFNFPIYDRLVLDGLAEEKLIIKSHQPSLQYFERLMEIKEKYNVSIDDLDKYFWVLGKIRGGNLSLLIPNKETYIKFLDELSLDDTTKKDSSAKFNEAISKRLPTASFTDAKLRNIQKLAKSIKDDGNVFGKIEK